MGIINKFTSYSVRKRAIIVFGLIVTVVLSAFGWWLISPLFLPGKTLNEDLSDFDSTPPQSNSTMHAENGTNGQMGNGFALLYTGEFERIDNQHMGTGNIRIVNSTDGVLTLIFDDVVISNGPELKVYLSSKSSFSGTGDSAGDYTSLGDLKANIGNFTMNIPSGTTLTDYNSVLIWCEPFAVVFTWATLVLA